MPPRPPRTTSIDAHLDVAWTVLSPTHELPVPPLPPWREWAEATKCWWEGLWRLPQAVMWDPSGIPWQPAALVVEAMVSGELDPVRAAAELRQYEDRFGANSRSMLGLRWRVAGMANQEPERRSTSTTAGLDASRRRRLSKGMAA